MNLRVSDIRADDLPLLASPNEIRCTLTLRSDSGRVDYQQKKTTPYVSDAGSGYVWSDLCYIFGESNLLRNGDLLRCKLKSASGAELGKLLLPVSEVSTEPTSDWYDLKLNGIKCQGKIHLRLQLIEVAKAVKRERLNTTNHLIPEKKVLFTGMLEKKKKSWDSFRWNARYFVLSDSPLVLRYYETEKHSTMKGSIPLTARVTLTRSSKKDCFGFAIFTDDGKVRLRAETAELRDKWVKELTKRL